MAETESTHTAPSGYEPCINYTGSTKGYQDAAADALIEMEREISPYSWITVMCGNEACVQPAHLRVQSPLRMAYPYGVCIYCGRHAGTRDHLLPRRWTGDAKRHFVVTVPACGTCNSTISDTLTWSITERRAICHTRLRRKFGRLLRAPDRTPEELDEYGPMLREFIEQEADKKAEVKRMLAWPTDAAYDARALEKSGILDPYAVGLILPDDVDLEGYVQGEGVDDW